MAHEHDDWEREDPQAFPRLLLESDIPFEERRPALLVKARRLLRQAEHEWQRRLYQRIADGLAQGRRFGTVTGTIEAVSLPAEGDPPLETVAEIEQVLARHADEEEGEEEGNA